MSAASEPAGRNPAGGAGKAERRLTQGAARRLRRQAQRCPVKVGGKGSKRLQCTSDFGDYARITSLESLTQADRTMSCTNVIKLQNLSQPEMIAEICGRRTIGGHLEQPLVPLKDRPYASALVGNYKPLLGSWLSRRSLRIALDPIDESGFKLVYDALQNWVKANPGAPRLLSEIPEIHSLIETKQISEHFGQRRIAADLLSPIGVYQLFRQSFFQVGEALGPIERTVLVAPFETVEITETTSIRRLREDSLEDFSERQTDSSRETSDSTEISEETATLARKETKQSVSASVPIMVTGSVKASNDVSDVQEQSRKEAKKFLRSVTTKASEKLIKRLTVSTKVVTESLSTSSTRRLIRNDTKEPVNYSVRRLYRKDEVRVQDLGSQLAWQTYVPSPGRGFAEKLQQIASPTPRKSLIASVQVSNASRG